MAPRRRPRPRISRRDFLRMAGLTSGGMALAACRPSRTAPSPTAAAGGPRRGGTLRIAFPGTPGQLDPALYTSQEDYTIGFAVFSGLTWVDRNLRAQPDLAESWSSSEDLLTWTFELREGVRFQHGTEFTAQDVVYTFERILDESLGSPFRAVINYVDRLEAADEHTVRFHLNAPSADLPVNLGAVQARVVPHDRTTEQLSDDAFGSGPFLLEEYLPGDHTTLVRNEEYWNPDLPYLDEVRHVYMPEEATQIAALTGGSIDMMWQLGFENIPTVEADPSIVVGQVPSGTYQDIVMRTIDEPFTDVRVREAMKYCVDRAGVQQVVLQGRGDLGNDHPIPPINPYYAADLPIREQDHARARELLAEAGYPEGLQVTLHTSPVRPGLVDYAVAFQEMAKPAGIEVQVERVPADGYWSETWMKVPLCMSNWQLRPTADETLSTAYHSGAKWNESFFESEELDELIERARGEKDEGARQELYAAAQELLRNQGGVVISYFKPSVMAMRAEVQNFQPHPATWINVRETWLGAEA